MLRVGAEGLDGEAGLRTSELAAEALAAALG